MLRITALGLVVASVFLTSPPSATAQNTVLLAELYGEGVHAYFAGDYRQAYQSLSSAMEGGSNDPRVFYFRGLTLLQLGRSDEAEEDFASGANAEVRDVDQYYDINMSLQRVQGASRLTIEDYRQRARIAAAEQARQEQRLRYERRQGNEAAVLRQPYAPSGGGDELPAPDDAAESDEDLFAPDGALTGDVTEVPAEESPLIDLFDDRPSPGRRDAGSLDIDPFAPIADRSGDPPEDEIPESFGDDAGPLEFGNEDVDSSGLEGEEPFDFGDPGGSFEPAEPADDFADSGEESGEATESGESEGGSFSMGGFLRGLVPALIGAEDEPTEGLDQFPGGFPGEAGGFPGEAGGFPDDEGGFPGDEEEFQEFGPDGESDETSDPFTDDDNPPAAADVPPASLDDLLGDE